MAVAVLGRLLWHQHNSKWKYNDSAQFFLGEERCGGHMNKLYIRSCYTEIVKQIEEASSTHVLVRGTPGIGKSVFMFYYIYYLATKNGGNISLRLTYRNSDAKPTWYLLRQMVSCVSRQLLLELCHIIFSLTMSIYKVLAMLPS